MSDYSESRSFSVTRKAQKEHLPNESTSVKSITHVRTQRLKKVSSGILIRDDSFQLVFSLLQISAMLLHCLHNQKILIKHTIICVPQKTSEV